MFAGGCSDPCFYCSVLGLAFVSGNAKCAMDSLDQGFVGTRSLFFFANHYGAIDVRANALESHAARSTSSKNYAVDAHHLFRHVLFLPGGTGVVLGC